MFLPSSREYTKWFEPDFEHDEAGRRKGSTAGQAEEIDVIRALKARRRFREVNECAGEPW